jgi:predicted nucleic acid-binding protein
MDSLLAATALARNLSIASRNLHDFPDVPGVNPWE